MNVKPQCFHDSVPYYFPYIIDNLKCSQCGKHSKQRKDNNKQKMLLVMSENYLGQESALTLSR